MKDNGCCEFCGRSIKGEPTIKTIRGKKHIFCTEFCFRLSFYDVPDITYADLKEMYKLRCINVKSPDFQELIYKENSEHA